MIKAKQGRRTAAQTKAPLPIDFKWTHLFGYEQTLSSLSRALLADKLPPVILFTGRDGCGKRLLLQAIAALYYCQSHSACGQCPPCREVSSGTHPDILTLEPESGRIKVEAAAAAQEHLSYCPRPQDTQGIARRIVCIADVDLMTPQACNRLLKIWEEPPANCSFFLSTARKNTLLPTLLSRTVVWPLPPPPLARTLAWVKDELKARSMPMPTDAQLSDFIRKKGYAPGKVIAELGTAAGQELAQRRQSLLRLLVGQNGGLVGQNGGLVGQNEAILLAATESYTKNWGWSLGDFIHECEYALNDAYRQSVLPHQKQNPNQVSPVMIQKRRELLGQLHRLVLRQRITLNSQLALEHLALLSKMYI